MVLTSKTTTESIGYKEWLRYVGATRNSDLQAHRIAATYGELAGKLDGVIHAENAVHKQLRSSRSAGSPNANWFHFAMWGTLTVTRNVSNERPPQRIDTLPTAALRRRLTPLVIQARAASGQRVGRALSWGQRLIFVSVCYSVEYLLRWLEDHPDADPGQFDPMADANRADAGIDDIVALGRWDDREWIQRKRHLEMITEALRFYIHARHAPDPATRAKCVLGGNVLLTAVEQDLVDPAIRAVVDHVPRMVVASAEAATSRWVERLTSIPTQITSLNLPFRYPATRSAFDTAWSRLMTDQVLVIALPTETLRLGRDIPARWPGQPYYPEALQTFTPPHGVTLTPALDKALAEVSALVNSFDRTAGDGRGSAARDWRRWDERMNWAVTLMRSRQQDESLYWAPYSEEDLKRIERGELPHRSGDASALEVQAPIDGLAFEAFS